MVAACVAVVVAVKLPPGTSKAAVVAAVVTQPRYGAAYGGMVRSTKSAARQVWSHTLCLATSVHILCRNILMVSEHTQGHSYCIDAACGLDGA